MERVIHTTGVLLRMYDGFATWSLEMAYNSNCVQSDIGYSYLAYNISRLPIERLLLTTEMG